MANDRQISSLNEGDGEILLGDDVKIGEDVKINVTERLKIGPRSTIGDHVIIEGRDIEIGTEAWVDRYAQIGGGGCFEAPSSFKMGYWGHLGRGVFINTARPVTIGDEVGLGTDTKLYTHGAYISALEGFPVNFAPIIIGSRVWIPGATVLPGIKIGDDVVVGVGSVVTKDLPSGCLAMGVPARLVRQNAFPASLNPEQRVKLLAQILWRYMGQIDITPWRVTVNKSETLFRINTWEIEGPADAMTRRIKNELRRHGIRFKSYASHGEYVPWEKI